MKTAHNKTDAVRWSVIQIGPTKKTIGHYADEARAEVERGRYLSRPHGSGCGPIVKIYRIEPGEFLFSRK
jgi:hypothetical protein